jgi:hypothetical protein
MTSAWKALVALALTLLLAACGGGGGGGGGGGSSSGTVTNCSLSSLGANSTLSRSATAGERLTITFSLIGGAASNCSVSYSASNLPAGLSLNPSTGEVTGAVSTAGFYSFSVTTRVTSTNGGSGDVQSRSVSLTVTAPTVTLAPASTIWSITSSNSGLPTDTTTRMNLLTVGTNLYALLPVKQAGNFVPQLWKSTNAGVSWTNTNLNAPAPTGNLFGFSAVSDGTNIYLVGGFNSPITATTNNYSNAVYSIAPNSSTPTWVTKTIAAFPSGRASVGLTNSGSVLYAHGGVSSTGTPDGLYRSSNGGVTWDNITGSSNPFLNRHCLLVNGTNMLLIGGFGGPSTSTVGTDSTVIYKSVNSGASWSVITNAHPTLPVAVSCISSGNKVVVTGGSDNSFVSRAIYRSADFGSTWQLEPGNTAIPTRAYHGLTILGTNMVTAGGLGTSSWLNDVLTAPF